MEVAIIKSFTYENSGGNGAGVVILNEQITDSEKQSIASKVGLSETAFILKNNENDYDVSFFTPLCQVDLCGHATIAAFYYLSIKGYIKGSNEIKTVYQNTKAGKLKIEITFKNGDVDYVLMQQGSPRIYIELTDKKLQIANSLNIQEKSIKLAEYNLNPTIVSTGLKDILIPVESKYVLNNIKPNFEMIKIISEENDVVGYHVFTIDEGKIYARNFAPSVGIDEECATGTSNGALGGLLNAIGLAFNEFEVIQGESMNQKSLIYVKVNKFNNTLDVYVGGRANIDEIIKI